MLGRKHGTERGLDQVLALRPFVPARDYELSRRFYETIGFRVTHADESVTNLKLGGYSFILQNFYQKELAENLMLQLMLRDADAWWAQLPTDLADAFGVKQPRPPAMQPWRLKVGFLFDPSGVLWHVADSVF